MSYLVFARKWRPQTFDDVVGQEHVTSTIKRAIEKDRVAHAYVFSGTRGVGKTTTARILARALNCDNGPTPEPCGTCDTCKSILSGSSFDVLEIDGASNGRVEDVRELRDNVNYTSMGGKYRIYVIDEVHMMSKGAFNALLKTLEEPPKRVIFIFATTEPRKIPDTILSRCQRYDFRRISSEKILARIEYICTSENIKFDSKALALIAHKADGSMRDALSLLDQVYAFGQDSMDEKTVRSVLGLVETEVFGNIMDAVAQKNAEPVLNAVQQVLYNGYDLHEFLDGFLEYLRDLLFARVPGVLEKQRGDVSAEQITALAEKTRNFAEGDLLRMVEILKKVEYDLKWSSYPRFLVEIALLKIVNMDTTVSIEDILTSIKSYPVSDTSVKKKIKIVEEKQATLNVSPNSHDISSSDVKPLSVTVDNTSDFAVNTPDKFSNSKEMWSAFVDSLSKERPNLASFLSCAKLENYSDNLIEIKFNSGFSFQYFGVTNSKDNDLIKEKLNKFAGRDIELHIIKSEESENEEVSQDAVNSNVSVKVNLSVDDYIEKEPIIKTIIEKFNGEVI